MRMSSFEFPGGPCGKGFDCDPQLVAAALDSPALDEGLGVGAGAERPEPLKEWREGPGGVRGGAGFSPSQTRRGASVSPSVKQGTNTGPSTCSQCPCWVTLGQKLALSAPWRGLCDRGRGSEAPCRSPPRQRWGGVPASGSAGGAPASPPARPPQDSSSGAQRHGGEIE